MAKRSRSWLLHCQKEGPADQSLFWRSVGFEHPWHSFCEKELSLSRTRKSHAGGLSRIACQRRCWSVLSSWVPYDESVSPSLGEQKKGPGKALGMWRARIPQSKEEHLAGCKQHAVTSKDRKVSHSIQDRSICTLISTSLYPIPKPNEKENHTKCSHISPFLSNRIFPTFLSFFLPRIPGTHSKCKKFL